MKADKMHHLLKEFGFLINGWDSELKNGSVAHAHIQASNRELEKIEPLSDIGQAYQWAFDNGIIAISPESLVRKFKESEGKE